MNSSFHQSKVKLRSQCRAILRELSLETKAQASASICAQLRSWPVFRQARVIALFYPTSLEPDLLPLVQVPGKTFLFPRCHPDKSLTWHPPAGIEQWERSTNGIVEPDPVLSPAHPSDTLELVLVPGLAFTPGGVRLGHGGGYYDRFLSQLGPQIPTAGLCFSSQIQEHLPSETHDILIQQLFHSPAK